MGHTCCRSAPGLTHVCPRSESGLEQICFCDGIHACLSPDSDMSISKRNMHHVWTRSEIGKILRCSDLVSKFLLDRFPLTKTSKRLGADQFKGLKTVLINFFLQTRQKNKLFKRFIEYRYISCCAGVTVSKTAQCLPLSQKLRRSFFCCQSIEKATSGRKNQDLPNIGCEFLVAQSNSLLKNSVFRRA